MRKPLIWTIGVVVAVAVLVTAGTFVYINVIKDDAPAAFTDSSNTSNTTSGAPLAPIADLNGDWKVADGSQVGYRAKEVLFGQDTEGVGRTSDVTGSLNLSSLTVNSAEFTADMTTVKSDSSNRDNQFNGRIMSTSQYPTSTFKLTQPLKLPVEPSSTAQAVTATGDLTVHGVTKPVTFEMNFTQVGTDVNVTGTIPLKFTDYSIPDPTFGPAQVEDNATLEFSLNFTK